MRLTTAAHCSADSTILRAKRWYSSEVRGRDSMSWAYPMTPPSRLLKLWATPAAISPRARSFSDSCTCSRKRWAARSRSRRSEMSRPIPCTPTGCPPSTIQRAAISSVVRVPSLCTTWASWAGRGPGGGHRASSLRMRSLSSGASRS